MLEVDMRPRSSGAGILDKGMIATLFPNRINVLSARRIYKETSNPLGHTMKPARTIFTLFIALLALPIAAAAQDENSSTGATRDDEAIDSIAVVGQKSLAELRRDVYKAEEDFYSIYNKLNDDREYDVNCFYEKATGTNIKNHVCRARFVTNAYERHARRNRNNLSRVANQNSDAILQEQTAVFQEKLQKLIATNPELEEAVVRYNTLRAQFVAVREDSVSN